MAFVFRRIFRVFWWIICCCALIALPLAIWDFSRKGYDIKYQAWFIGGVFAILSVPISTYGVAMHTEYYTRPRLQRHVIRILWMVPIYSIDSWFALRFHSAREYLDPIRECYEAYVIYNFFAYLMAYLEEELGDVEAHLAQKPPMKHLPPFKWILQPWQMGHPFLLECKKGIMNYVILRPLTTAAALTTDMFGLYGQGQLDLTKSYVYLTGLTNFSQLWALYCLGQMYWAVHKELAPIRPLSKFICIKAVVFMTFWQGTTLVLLVSTGIISDKFWASDDQLGEAAGIQDFLICIEMFVAAIAHSHAFPPRDYMHPSDQCELDGGFLHNVKHMFDLTDVARDVRMVLTQHFGTASGAVKHATITLPKQTARGLGIVKKKQEDADGKSERSLLEIHKGEDGHRYHAMAPRSSDDGSDNDNEGGAGSDGMSHSNNNLGSRLLPGSSPGKGKKGGVANGGGGVVGDEEMGMRGPQHTPPGKGGGSSSGVGGGKSGGGGQGSVERKHSGGLKGKLARVGIWSKGKHGRGGGGEGGGGVDGDDARASLLGGQLDSSAASSSSQQHCAAVGWAASTSGHAQGAQRSSSSSCSGSNPEQSHSQEATHRRNASHDGALNWGGNSVGWWPQSTGPPPSLSTASQGEPHEFSAAANTGASKSAGNVRELARVSTHAPMHSATSAPATAEEAGQRASSGTATDGAVTHSEGHTAAVPWPLPAPSPQSSSRGRRFSHLGPHHHALQMMGSQGEGRESNVEQQQQQQQQQEQQWGGTEAGEVPHSRWHVRKKQHPQQVPLVERDRWQPAQQQQQAGQEGVFPVHQTQTGLP